MTINDNFNCIIKLKIFFLKTEANITILVKVEKAWQQNTISYTIVKCSDNTLLAY